MASASLLSRLSLSSSPDLSYTASAASALYTLSLHDALPIFEGVGFRLGPTPADQAGRMICPVPVDRGDMPIGMSPRSTGTGQDRKSTRLNSSHGYISYAVFCLKKKNKTEPDNPVATM